MARGRKTGGRKAGEPNKVNSTLNELVEAEAGAPLPVLLVRIGMAAMKRGDHQLAVNALSRAAVYVYPRVQPIDPPAPPHPGITIRFEDPPACASCGFAAKAVLCGNKNDPVAILDDIPPAV